MGEARGGRRCARGRAACESRYHPAPVSGLPPAILAEFSDDAIVRSDALLALRRVQIAGEHDGWIAALVRDNGVPCAVLLRTIGNASSRKVQLFCSCEDAKDRAPLRNSGTVTRKAASSFLLV